MMPLPKVEMTVFETMLARRSVRKYKARGVSQETIRILLEAAVRAPTAIHQEPWGFVLVQDKKLLQDLSDYAKPLFLNEIHPNSLQHSASIINTFNRPEFNIFYDASTLIIICGKKAAAYFEADCWLAAENLMLAACAMGLGTCIIGSALPAMNVADVRTKLGISDEFIAVAPIVLGYPDDGIEPVQRRSPVVLANIFADVIN